jgi:hypothetical protein
VTSRQKGYVLLDSNLKEIQTVVGRRLSIWLNDSNWETIVKNRIYGSRDDAPNELNLDYNDFPVIVRNYPSAFPSLSNEKSDIFRLFAEVRDKRNQIAHHLPFSESSLENLHEDLAKIFNYFHITSKFQLITNQIESSPNQEAKSHITDHIDNWDMKKNFIIAERLRGKGLIICTEFARGKNAGKKFVYSHDEVYDVTIGALKKLDSWKKYHYNVSSTSIRTEALPYVKQVL